MRNFDLLQIVAMNLDENFNPERMCMLRQLRNVFEGLRDHETGCATLLDCIADCIKSDGADASLVKAGQDALKVSLTLSRQHINVDLLRGECSPEQMFLTVGQSGVSEWKTWSGPVDLQEVLFGGTFWKDAIESEHHD